MPEATAYSRLAWRTLFSAVRGACGAGVSSEPVKPTSGSNLVDCVSAPETQRETASCEACQGAMAAESHSNSAEKRQRHCRLSAQRSAKSGSV